MEGWHLGSWLLETRLRLDLSTWPALNAPGWDNRGSLQTLLSCESFPDGAGTSLSPEFGGAEPSQQERLSNPGTGRDLRGTWSRLAPVLRRQARQTPSGLSHS